MNVAFICDWLTGMRGGERCLEAICELYPDANIFTLVHFPGAVSQAIESHKIYTSYIKHLPGDLKHFRRYLPLFGHAIQRFDLSSYDCVVSFSHCVAKSVKVPNGIPHICYCHTPMRYAWYMRNEYLNSFGFPKRKALSLMLDYLKKWDKRNSSGVTHFIANSKNVQRRIKDAYNTNSIVIYPPVDCNRFKFSHQNDGYYLIVSALVSYKRIELAVKTLRDTELKLLIVGNGPEMKNLKNKATNNITFVENADDRQVVEYMRACTALIFPGEEDFGIVPLEAQACGKPVIAFGKGGALETVIGLNHSRSAQADPTGIFFYEQCPKALLEAVQLFEKKRDKFNANNCRDNAIKFDRPVYQLSMQKYIEYIKANHN